MRRGRPGSRLHAAAWLVVVLAYGQALGRVLVPAPPARDALAALAGLDRFPSPWPAPPHLAMRHPAVRTVTAFGSAAIPACVAVLDDPTRADRTRIAAALALGALDAELAIPSLVRAARAPALTQVATIALVRVCETALARAAGERDLDPAGRERLVLAARTLFQGDPAQRRLAMRLAGRVGASAVDLVERGLADTERAVVIAAMSSEAALIAQARDGAVEARRAALADRVRALSGHATPEELRVLAGAAETARLVSLDAPMRGWLVAGSVEERVAAIAIVGAVADGAIAGGLVALVLDPDPRISAEAARALRRLFGRGRREWRDFHFGGANAPASRADWKAWWTSQSWIYQQRRLYEAERAEGLRLLRLRKYASMREAVRLFDSARERLIQIGERKTAGGDPDGGLLHLLTELTVIEMR